MSSSSSANVMFLLFLLLFGLYFERTQGILPGGIRVDRGTSTLRDNLNRTRIFHGYNFVEKSPPYYPTFTDDDIELMKNLGTTVIRLGVMMDGLFPTNEKPDEIYITNIKNIITQLWENNITTIADLHQDVLQAKICGEGLPDWVLNTEKLNSLPFPEPLVFHNTSIANNSAPMGWTPPISCSAEGKLEFIGWSEFYLTDASAKAWQHIYDDQGLLGKMFSVHWSVVANALKDMDGVLAYEMLNEPWVGDWIEDPLLLLEAGVAETKNVGRYMERIHQRIRDVDNETLVLFSPAEVNNRLMRHVGYQNGFLPGEPMAWHVYCVVGTDASGPQSLFAKLLCHMNDGAQVDVRDSDLKRLQTAGFVTEFGAVDSSPSGLAEVRYVSEQLDRIRVSWCYWSDGSFENQSPSMNAEIARSYPRIVAGDLLGFKFDSKTGEFWMKYKPNFVPGGGEAVSSYVFLSDVYHYPNGYDWEIYPSSCCSVLEQQNGMKIVQVTEVDEIWFRVVPK